jgi:hypothetical protein
MITIAGGVILGVIGLVVIGAIISWMSENAEVVGIGCAGIIGLAVLYALWASLN